jgi:hypothetical protein
MSSKEGYCGKPVNQCPYADYCVLYRSMINAYPSKDKREEQIKKMLEDIKQHPEILAPLCARALAYKH